MTNPDPSPDRPPEPPEAEPVDDALFQEALGRAIKVLRTGLDRSRSAVAKDAGLSYSYLAEIETGRKRASAAAQQAIAAALGVPVSELLAAAEDWALRIGDERPAARLGLSPTQAARLPPAAVERSGAGAGARARQERWYHASALRSPRGRSTSSADGVRKLELSELAELAARLDPADRATLLDLARRLAER
jgi:transcriptional regulator with XRE-family HTH domain